MDKHSTTKRTTGNWTSFAAATFALWIAGSALAANNEDPSVSGNLMELISDSRWVQGGAQQRVYLAQMQLRGAEVALNNAELEIEVSQSSLTKTRDEYKQALAQLAEARKDGDARWIGAAEATVAATAESVDAAQARVKWAKLQLQARKALIKQLNTDVKLAEVELELAKAADAVDQDSVAMRNQVLQYQDNADEASSRTRRLEQRARIARVQWESAQAGLAR